jgi:GcrA cell cycle regulator
MEWNDERIATLTKLWREGLSAAQAARQLGGVSRSAVIGKVHRLGIAGRDAPSRPASQGPRSLARIRASAGGVRRTSSVRTPPATPAPSSRGVCDMAPTATIHSLTKGACRWPIGEPGEADFGFCGRIQIGAGSYCAGHAAVAVRRRESPMKTKEIDQMVSRFVEGAAYARQPADFSWREVA